MSINIDCDWLIRNSISLAARGDFLLVAQDSIVAEPRILANSATIRDSPN